MILGWGALIAGFGVFLLVLNIAAQLLPAVFAVILVVVGIAGVGYSFRRSSPVTSKASAS
jgi:hypothetical protein